MKTLPLESARTLATWLLVGVLAVGSCAENPVTGKRELALLSQEQELELGRQAAEQAERSLGLVQDDALQQYVQRIGAQMAAKSERPELPWTFRIVDDPTPNAFALPGGYIFITRGMLGYMSSEAELASVIGHEIGHVTARHSVQQISRAQLGQLGLGLGMILFPEAQQLGGLLSSGLQLLFLRYGREAERQADDLGFRYALEQGYDVREMDDVFATLQRIGEKEQRSPIPAWASTHPDPGERIEAVRQRVAAADVQWDKLRTGQQELLQRVDGLTFGENPRHGYFEGNAFLHPDLAFRLDFPEGWRTQNMPQAVLAGSPQQDAVLQLLPAPGDPTEAARQFFAQEGVQPGQLVRQTINGLPATLGSFQAQTQQGVVRGIAGFIAHRDHTYALVGFTPAQRYAQMERTFLQTIESFAPLTDEKALAVQPRVIDVVQIPRAMTLEEFARAYPSANETNLETLVLINQVPDARTKLPAGTRVKRVIERKG